MRVLQLSDELIKWRDFIRKKAVDVGLDFFEVVYEMVDYQEMNELAALGGFPTRYPHWRFGMEYDRMAKSYAYGFSKIYEMVINTDPCYAYLLNSNSTLEHKLVMAHVYGHSDFFKNNIYFSNTNRKMLDQMANHAVSIRKFQELYGIEVVEEFIDCCLSLENLIDHRLTGVQHDKKKRSIDPVNEAIPEKKEPTSSNYLDKFIRTERELRGQKEKVEVEVKKKDRVPEKPVRDVLGFLLENAPLKPWQQEVLELIREEAYYFAPQGQTKIMNEGWASYWHTKLMTEKILSDSEVVDYACVHSGTVATQPGGLNPYKLGIELFRHIERRWDRGQFGKDWEYCEDYLAKQMWDTKAGLGREKIFQVRKLYNDLTFIDEFMTEDFCREQKLFTFAFNERTGDQEIESRDFSKVKSQLLSQLTNFGNPIIEVVDANFENQSSLLLKHQFVDRPLRMDYAEHTLKNLYKIWSKSVFIESMQEDKKVLLGFDGKEFKVRQI